MLSHLRAPLTRLRELLRRRSRAAAEQDEEFSFHLEMETAENMRRGMNEAAARRAAALRFGGTQRFREETNDARGVVAFDNLARDTRFAIRRLRRAPAFAMGVIATLGIGIGAAAGIGTMVYDVLLRDLPYKKPDQLVRVGFITDGIGVTGDLQSAATYFHFAKSARSFSELGAYSTSDAFAITDADTPERVTVALVTPSVLTLLGARPMLGQLFERGDTSWYGARHPILISQNLWQRRYGADPSIIGRAIRFDHGERTVIGVLPRSFAFPTASVEIFYPTAVPVNPPQITSRYFNVIGRLREGFSPSSAQLELNALIPSLSERFPEITRDMLRQSRAHVAVETLRAATVAPVHAQFVLLGVLVAIVLLIATTNVLDLFLLRTERASQEIAIALSLGATRAAVVQRFVMEGLVLGLLSAVVALPATALALATKFGFTEREIPRLNEVALNRDTVALVLGCAVVIGAAVGLIALTRTGTGGLEHLRGGPSTSGRTWRRTQNGLVSFQVAIALMLLVAAALLGRSFWNLSKASIGFDPTNAMTFQVSLPWGPDGYTSYGKVAAFHAKLIEQLEALPEIKSVGVALRLPLANRGLPNLDVQIQAGDDRKRPIVAAVFNMASPEYFRTMRIPLRAGRSFRSGDLRGTPAVIVSERVATSLFGTTHVVGRIIRRLRDDTPPTTFTIVAVVGDVQWERIEDGEVPMVYFPLLRDADGLPADSNPLQYLPMVVQYAVGGTQLPTFPAIQRMLKQLDPRVPAANVRTLGSVVDDATARVRLTMLLMATAGAAALLLAVIGVYSVIGYAANARVREFGIRLALGAAPARLGGMIMGDGLKLVGIGTFAGLMAALGATRLLRALLYQVKVTSFAEFGIATVLLAVATLLATLVPAWRAARTNPGVVLRGE
ncbi:MAG: ADOP family duplicated permease [Gemmatimonadaceae bacterium]